MVVGHFGRTSIMNRALILVSVFLLFSLPAFPQNTAEKRTLNDLSWFSGCWQMERAPGRVSFEQWTRPQGIMIGLAYSLRDGKIVDHEFLRLIERDGDIFYVAIPVRQKETDFKLTSLKGGTAVFENPEHDFPQRIIYRKSDGGISVRVEGEENGQTRGFDLIYSAVECG